MSLSATNSVVESDWRERVGEPQRDRQMDSTAPNGTRPALPDPQGMPKAEKAKRRRFNASQKQRILVAMDQATESGEIGRILRRDGIDHSQLNKWRRQRAEGIDLGLRERRAAQKAQA